MTFPSHIKVAAVLVTRFFDARTSETGEEDFYGVEGRLLTTLAKVLNFKITHLSPPDYKIGVKEENGTWSGVMGMLQRKEADFGMCGIAMLSNRLEVVDFSQVFSIQRLTFLVEKPGSLPAVWAFVQIFDPVLWGIIFLTLFIAPFVGSLFVNKKQSVTELFIQFFGNILRQPLDFNMTTSKSRIFITSWLIFSLVISFGYSACLLSYLSLPLQGKPITTFVELAQAVRKGTHKCRMLNGAPAVNFLIESKNKELHFLGKTIKDKNWFYLPHQGIDTKTVEGKAAMVNSDFALKLLLSKLPPGSFLISEDSLISFKFGIALRKEFCCREKLNTILSRVIAAGLFQKYQRDELLKVRIESIKKFPPQKSVVQQLRVNDLIGTIYIFIGGIVISFLILLGEIAHFRIKNTGR